MPSDLSLPDLDPRRYFTAEQLEETASYERFIRIDLILSLVATIVALAIFARRAPQFARNTGLGPIGAGLIVGMVVLMILWAVDLPFSIALRWWAERHGLTKGGWAEWLIEPWATLGGAVAFVMLQIVGDHGLRPAVPAVLVGARDADLPRARDCLQPRPSVPGRRPGP